VAPSVVTIEDLMTVQGVDVEEGIGSGFVWDSFGHIVTNSHVISKVANDKTGTQVRFTTPLAA
jgi:S1-C subfamily serine protease